MTLIPKGHETENAKVDHFNRVLPAKSFVRRAVGVLRQSAGEMARTVMHRVPGLAGRFDQPRLEQLRSGSSFMMDWFNKPYGSDEKPAKLAEIPWDYVEQYRNEIPFEGLREYWYPALRSHELRNNEAKAVKLLGTNLVLFRGPDGAPRALDNRCPHRGPLLSLGQVGVWEPGTLTCRYHGATFDGDGECVAFLADGPNSPACGKFHVRSYPVQERRGIIFAYMGDRPAPRLERSLPHGRTVLNQKHLYVSPYKVPFSHLNILDNTADLTHVGCLHRTCMFFGDQAPHGELAYEDLNGKGIRAYFKSDVPHAGPFSINEVRWFLPNLVYHAPGDTGGPFTEGWFWFVPRDAGSFTAWLIMGVADDAGPIRKKLAFKLAHNLIQGTNLPSVACFIGGDAPMLASQGRIARWDQDKLARTDRVIVKVRQMLKAAHKAEVAERRARVETKSFIRLRA